MAYESFFNDFSVRLSSVYKEMLDTLTNSIHII